VSDLVPYLVDGAGQRYPMAGAVTTLGRSSRCDVLVPDPRASRRHAEIHWDGEGSSLRDLESTNGTLLNSRPVRAPQPLRDGDEIAIGSTILTFRDPEATLRAGDLPLLVVDGQSGEIWVDQAQVALSPKERALFDLLHGCAGSACSKQDIALAVWPEYEAEVYDYQIEALVKRLREKLEPDPREPVLVVTVRGQGYKLVVH